MRDPRVVDDSELPHRVTFAEERVVRSHLDVVAKSLRTVFVGVATARPATLTVVDRRRVRTRHYGRKGGQSRPVHPSGKSKPPSLAEHGRGQNWCVTERETQIHAPSRQNMPMPVSLMQTAPDAAQEASHVSVGAHGMEHSDSELHGCGGDHASPKGAPSGITALASLSAFCEAPVHWPIVTGPALQAKRLAPITTPSASLATTSTA